MITFKQKDYLIWCANEMQWPTQDNWETFIHLEVVRSSIEKEVMKELGILELIEGEDK
jgi:hypothetical protein